MTDWEAFVILLILHKASVDFLGQYYGRMLLCRTENRSRASARCIKADVRKFGKGSTDVDQLVIGCKHEIPNSTEVKLTLAAIKSRSASQDFTTSLCS